MAKGIYVGAEGERAVSGDIIPKTWSVVTEDDEYISDNGIILKVGAGSMDSKPATNACDGSVDTYWQTTATTGAWLRLQFPEKKKITKMKLRATASTSSRVSKIDIRGRNEGGTWIDLYSTTTAQTALTEVALSNTDYYQYYIVNVTLSSSNYVEIYDWQTSEYVEKSTNGVAKKVTKAYVGVSEPEKLINFTSCPYSSADTDWVLVDASLYKHSFTNEYGTWIASGTDVSSSASSYLPYRALENLSNDNYGWAITTTLGEHILTLDFPQGILINPSKIHLKGNDNGYANTYIYGIKEDGSEEMLLDEYFNGNDFETDIDVVTNSYFSKLKLVWDCSKSSFTSKVNYIYELHVNEGTIKVAGYSNKARKIKKGYIGVAGIARPFFGGKELSYYGTAAALSQARYRLVGGSVGDYALFAGGENSSSVFATVDAYSSSLTKSTPTALTSKTRRFASASVGNYVLFAGGNLNMGTQSTSSVIRYNKSLAQGTATSLSKSRYYLTGASNPNYAIFAGGTFDGTSYKNVDAYNSNLTKSTATELTAYAYLMAGASVGNYALFAGGLETNRTSRVTAYDSNLTKSTPASLTYAKNALGGTNVGNYALFAGGARDGGNGVIYSTEVDVFDSNLVKSTPTSLSMGRQSPTTASVGGFALFSGGSQAVTATVDAFDLNLTKSSPTNLSVARYEHAGASVGNYAIFAGGYSGNFETTVDVYQVTE